MVSFFDAYFHLLFICCLSVICLDLLDLLISEGCRLFWVETCCGLEMAEFTTNFIASRGLLVV